MASVDDVVVDVVAVKGEGIVLYGITCLLNIYIKTIQSLYLLSSRAACLMLNVCSNQSMLVHVINLTFTMYENVHSENETFICHLSFFCTIRPGWQL